MNARLKVRLKEGQTRKQREEILRLYLLNLMAKHLKMDASSLDTDTPLVDFGLTSLGAAEITGDILDDTGVDLDISEVLDGRSICTLIREILDEFEVRNN